MSLTKVTAGMIASGAVVSHLGYTPQPSDADLTAIAALTGTSGFLKKTAADTWSLDTNVYLTGVTSGQVTTALGFTPYNATNPNGYISSITSANVTTALGFTPYNATNPSGYLASLNVGTLGYATTNVLHYLQSSVNSYNQLILQNTSSGAAASADFVISNNLSTDTTYYGNLGMNSSGFTGSGSLSLANAVYLTATSGELVLGTTTANGVRFVVNGGATDAMSLSSAGVLTLGTALAIASGGTGATTAAGALTALGAYAASNPSGFITASGNAATATNVAWTGVTGKPTTLSGYGITDALSAASPTLTGTVTAGTKLIVTPGVTGVSTGLNVVNGDITAYRSGGTTGVMYLNSAGTAYLYWDATNYNLPVGNLIVGGNVTAYSDESLKKNWQDLPADFVDRLATVKMGVYDRTDIESTQVGVSAQSFQKVLPSAVQMGEGGKLAVSYGNAALASSVALAQRIIALEKRLATLMD